MHITQKIIKELIDYNPETGSMTWRERGIHWFPDERAMKVWNTKNAGNRVGSIHTSRNGYQCFRTQLPDRKKYYLHRVAWLWMSGEFPQGQVDHIDHNPLNNRWENLRVVSNQDNHRNRPRNRNNSSGATGVSWSRSRKTWVSQICIDYKTVPIGGFHSFEEAVEARRAAEEKHGFHGTHGLPREGD